MKYGLKYKCFRALMRIHNNFPYDYFKDINKEQPSPKAMGKLNDASLENFIADADKFERDFNISLSGAIDAILKNGWPDITEEEIHTRYRKSSHRNEHVLNIFREIIDPSSKEDLDNAMKASVVYDNDARQGVPCGPAYCNTFEKLTDKYVELIERFVCLNGIDAMLDEMQRIPDHPEKNPPQRLTIDDILDAIRARTLLEGQFSPSFVDRITGCAAYEAILPQELKDLRGVYVYVPLDCPEETRNAAIRKITDDWKSRRAQAGYKCNLRPRLINKADKISTIRLLPKHINYLRSLYQNTRADDNNPYHYLPRTCKGAVDKSAAGAMTVALIAKHVRLNPDCHKSDDILYKAIQDGLDEAHDTLIHETPSDSPYDGNVEDDAINE